MSITGTWEETTLDTVAKTAGFVWSVLDRNAEFVAIGSLVALAIIVGYVVKVVVEKTYHFARWLHWRARGWMHRAYHWVRKHRMFRRARGFIMAKWKRGVIADRVFDMLLQMNADGMLTNNEREELCIKIGHALDLPDLLPRKILKIALRAYFLGTEKSPPRYQKLAGPVKKIPGGPPSLHIPPVETNVVPASEFIRKLKEKQAA